MQEGVARGRREAELRHLRADRGRGALVGGLEPQHRGPNVRSTDEIVRGDLRRLRLRRHRQRVRHRVVAGTRLAPEQHREAQRGLGLEGVERGELAVDGDDELLLLTDLDVAREARAGTRAQQLEALLVHGLLLLQQGAACAVGDEVEIRLGDLGRDRERGRVGVRFRRERVVLRSALFEGVSPAEIDLVRDREREDRRARIHRSDAGRQAVADGARDLAVDGRKTRGAGLLGDGARFADRREGDLHVRARGDGLLDQRLEPRVDALGVRVGDVAFAERRW